MNIKKIGEIFLIIAAIIIFPIVSFNWYRFCKKKNDADKRKFIWYGVLGAIGVIGFVYAIVYSVHTTMPPLQGIIVLLFSCACYIFGGFKQADLIVKKRTKYPAPTPKKMLSYYNQL
jgi:hypothetical protein